MHTRSDRRHAVLTAASVRWLGAVLGVLQALPLCGCAAAQSFTRCEVLLACPWGSGTGELGRKLVPLSDQPGNVVRFVPGDALAHAGKLYVADSVNRRVVIFAREGEGYRAKGTLDPAPVTGTPVRLAVTGDGSLAVFQTAPQPNADGRNDAVVLFNAGGQPVAGLGPLPRPAHVPADAPMEPQIDGMFASGADVCLWEPTSSGIRIHWGDVAAHQIRTLVEVRLASHESVKGVGAAPRGGRGAMWYIVKGAAARKGEGYVHQCRRVTLAADGQEVESTPFTLRSRTETVGLRCLGAGADGRTHFLKQDWAPDPHGTLRAKDMVESIIAVGRAGRVAPVKRTDELAELAHGAGVPSWDYVRYLRVDESGTLFAMSECESSLYLVAFD